MTEVRLRPSLRGSGQALGVITLVVCSVFFIIGGLYDPASIGGIIFITLGAVGVLGFGGVLVVILGHLLGRRPLLVLDDEGVRIPAKWPLSRSRDRFLPWTDIATVCAWSQGVPTGKGLAHQLAFLPTEESEAAQDPSGSEMVMIKTQGLPGVAIYRWSVPILPGWTVKPDEVFKAAKQHVPFEDRRIGVRKTRKVVRKAPPAA